jgi:hypothetical protein
MERLLLGFDQRNLSTSEFTMQQVALPSVYAPRHRAVSTAPFPLVRRQERERKRRSGTRRFVAGLLFGVLMSGTLVLLGYEARVFADSYPGGWREALDALKTFDW